MNLSEMRTLLEYYVDDVVETAIAIQLLNNGKDQMALVVDADFPNIELTADLGSTFVFDAKYHNLPVLYAAAMVKSYDSSLSEKNSYLQQFNEGLRRFEENYQVPMIYQTGAGIWQHTITSPTRSVSVTDPYYHTWSYVRIYINGTFRSDVVPNGTTINFPEELPVGTRVTVAYNPDPMYIKPAIW